MRRELLRCSYSNMRDVRIRAVPVPGPRLSWSHIVAAAELYRGRREFDDGLACDAAWWLRDHDPSFGQVSRGLAIAYGTLSDGIHRAYVGTHALDGKLVLDMLATWALNGPED